MQNRDIAPALTESRIRRILELEPELRRRTKKDAGKLLAVPRLPDLSQDETIIDVVAPQMSKYFAGWNEDPARFFQDRSRLLMIFLALKAGGIHKLIETYSQLATGDLLRSAIEKMKEQGFGSPATVEELLPQARKNAEHQVRQLQSVDAAEEEAVKNCMKEIEESICRR